ncbi:phosphatidate cytidylyltransferase [Paucibacter oligotrophus]|uniref:Phosphatidate cytidylyltransferase n=1 Tax=Roseateles oligotrophus TaxID=1769250 RepID=A0A840LE35_9BURK|nr:phosphatidate cytidylyltransferase [Roseateles oligotrophus]MBB4845235.1 phosphatidate cytidylyltransferase [Roseateles oligotrophus]
MNWLKTLDSNEQIALLFVTLFGALALASAASFLLGLRAREEDGEHALARRRKIQHELNLLWLGASLFWAAWISGPLGATLLFGVLSFLALREFITLLHTRRGDHRSLILAFFVLLPLQYLVVGLREFNLFTVLVPVYAFLAIPVVSALAGDPEDFLERNAKIQWGIMVCVYGLSHAPALILLDIPGYKGRGAFLLFFLVMVVSFGQLIEQAAAQRLRRRPVARQVSRTFSMRAWWAGIFAAALLGAALFWITPFTAVKAMLMAAVAAGAGSFGGLVMEALKRDAGVRSWGNRSSITGAVGLLDRIAVLCFSAPVFFHSVRWYFKWAQ